MRHSRIEASENTGSGRACPVDGSRGQTGVERITRLAQVPGDHQPDVRYRHGASPLPGGSVASWMIPAFRRATSAGVFGSRRSSSWTRERVFIFSRNTPGTPSHTVRAWVRGQPDRLPLPDRRPRPIPLPAMGLFLPDRHAPGTSERAVAPHCNRFAEPVRIPTIVRACTQHGRTRRPRGHLRGGQAFDPRGDPDIHHAVHALAGPCRRRKRRGPVPRRRARLAGHGAQQSVFKDMEVPLPKKTAMTSSSATAAISA